MLGAIAPAVCTQDGAGVTTCTATVTYTPAGNYNGPDTFSYKVNDGQADSNVVTVSITVVDNGAANQAPTAADGQASGSEDVALALTWAQFAVADPDGRPGALQVEITTLPADGPSGIHWGYVWATDGGGGYGVIPW